jgi:Superinfection immunity protein
MELLVFLALGYFLPTIIACIRKPDAKGNIIALSLLLGWLPMVSIICIIWALCAKTTSKQLDQVNLIAAAMVAAQNGQILNAAPVVPRAPKAQPEVRDWVKALGIVKAQPEPVA